MSRGEIRGGSDDLVAPPQDVSDKVNRRVRRGWVAWGLSVGVVIAAGLGVWGPGAEAMGWRTPGGAATLSGEALERLQPGAVVSTTTPPPTAVDTEALRAAVASVAGESGSYAAALGALEQGGTLVDMSAGTPMIPASSQKIMTTLSALETMGADHRFTTSVVATSPTTIVLVGGGDPLLSSTDTSYAHAGDVTVATTQVLAQQTAEALHTQGVTAVDLAWDDSLFTGQVWHPDWAAEDRTFASPISALVVDEAATTPDTSSPSQAAAQVFADQLTGLGIAVTLTGPGSGANGTTLASVDSPPLLALVRECLSHSDNFIADMLLRQLAVATGEEASFEGGSRALTATLTSLGLWSDGMHVVDGSGLSMNNRLTPASLVAAIQLAASRPELSGLLTGLPVGCATGTLEARFTEAASACGEVRAKTGTLNTVSSLVGYTPTADGALVAFALMGNDLPTDRDVRGWFDRVAGALAECRCGA